MRLILFILVFAVFLAFIVFNLDNKCVIDIGFYKFEGNNGEGIPVFLTAFFSFIFGMVFAVPLVFSFRKRKKNESQSKHVKGNPQSGIDEIKKENSSYGID